MVEMQVNAELSGHRIHHTQAFGYGLLANAIIGHPCNAMLCDSNAPENVAARAYPSNISSTNDLKTT
ncbi:MAG: hypothetical protein I8H87_07360 [Comamonadaceae bacterium]|jgi:hypothetical protein|nr:hypothetical protein [Comamonadaceae bacterium]